ncbi:MAG: hypothetical protein KDK25_05620 [Leptospiraceae bacterium]|nr:hypothetical protein [Leptospiraceae bacterium]
MIKNERRDSGNQKRSRDLTTTVAWLDRFVGMKLAKLIDLDIEAFLRDPYEPQFSKDLLSAIPNDLFRAEYSEPTGLLRFPQKFDPEKSAAMVITQDQYRGLRRYLDYIEKGRELHMSEDFLEMAIIEHVAPESIPMDPLV